MNLKPIAGLTILFVSAIIWSIYDLNQIYKFEDFIAEPLKYKKIYFSHSDNIPALLITLINNETKSIKAAYYTFTLESIADALIEAHHKGIDIEIIIDSSCLKNKPNAIKKLQTNNIKLFVYYCPFQEFKSLMHHKFMIFDSQPSYTTGFTESLVVTGSFNCTKAAAERHWENIVVLEDQVAKSSFNLEFENLIKECIVLV